MRKACNPIERVAPAGAIHTRMRRHSKRWMRFSKNSVC